MRNLENRANKRRENRRNEKALEETNLRDRVGEEKKKLRDSEM